MLDWHEDLKGYSDDRELIVLSAKPLNLQDPSYYQILQAHCVLIISTSRDSSPTDANQALLRNETVMLSRFANGRDRIRRDSIGSLSTQADNGKSICFGCRSWRSYLRRNDRTYSSTSREVLSALRITHVLKHNDVSESSFTTTPSG